MEGKIIHKVETYSDSLRPGYEYEVKHKKFLYSINEVSESGELQPFCTGVSLSVYSILTAAHCMQKYEKTNNYTNLRVSDNTKNNYEVLTSESHVDYESGFSDFTDICIVTVIFLANFSRCHRKKLIDFIAFRPVTTMGQPAQGSEEAPYLICH